MLPVPPKSAMTPRKQNFYDFSINTFERGEYLENFKNSSDYTNLSQDEKDIHNEEYEIIEQLNIFQVAQIEDY